MTRLKSSMHYYDICRKNIRKYRLEKNLTQQQLADKMNLSNKPISKWESGSDALQIPIYLLFKEN